VNLLGGRRNAAFAGNYPLGPTAKKRRIRHLWTTMGWTANG
jgi:hypothetical protein